MKKSKFLNLIKEEILNTLQEQTLEKKEQLQGSFKPELFKNLLGGDKFDLSKFTSAMTKLKNNQSRSTIDNAFLGDIVRALMFTDDNKVLTDIFTYLRTLKTK
jgi:primosomal protein N''